jgi:hypothetical protein
MRSLGGTSNQPVADEGAQVDVSDQLGADRDQAFKARQDESARQATVQSARAAAQRGDRESELRYAAEAVRLGVTGGARLDMLQRLCDGFEALGQATRADPYCDALVSEFPQSSAATAVAQRRSYQQRPEAAKASSEAPTKPAAAKPAPSKKAKKAVDASAY